jgi:hypothetical protein
MYDKRAIPTQNGGLILTTPKSSTLFLSVEVFWIII